MDPIVIAAIITVVGSVLTAVIAALVKFTIESRKARFENAAQHAHVAATLKALKKEGKRARKEAKADRAEVRDHMVADAKFQAILEPLVPALQEIVDRRDRSEAI